MEIAHKRRDITRTNKTDYTNRTGHVQTELIYLRWDALVHSHRTLSRANEKQNAMKTAHKRRAVTRTNKTNYTNRTEHVQVELIYLH